MPPSKYFDVFAERLAHTDLVEQTKLVKQTSAQNKDLSLSTERIRSRILTLFGGFVM